MLAAVLPLLVLAGWLWAGRGVGAGLRQHARETLARYDDAARKAAGTPGGAVTVPPPSERFLSGIQVEAATAVPSGRRLTVTFTGEAPGNGPCERDYDAEAFESANAVVVVLEGKPRDVLERLNVSLGAESCPSLGHLRTATVVLAQPLGGRVVLDGRSGRPVPVQAGD